MFRNLWSHHSGKHAGTAAVSVLSGATLFSWHTFVATPSADCEGVPEHDEPQPQSSSLSSSSSSTTSSSTSSSQRMPSRAETRFFTQYWSSSGGGGGTSASDGSRRGGHYSEAASGMGGGRQEAPSDMPSSSSFSKGRPDLPRGGERPKSRPPCPEWDFNWDGRMTEASSPETMSTRKGFYASRELGNVRHILLVRHGQYREDFKDDKRRVLTPLGRHQAELTGQRLAIMARGGLGMINPEFSGPCNIKAIHVSDMTRAKETAKIIASHLPGVPLMEPDPMLNEALPADMVPERPDIDAEAARREILANQDRIEAAFLKYIHRAEPYDDHEMVEHSHDEEFDDNPHEYEVIVAHGNVIRYFFCRALQLPPEVWLRFSTFNCSITYIMVQPNGLVSVRGMGDFGHLGYDNLTFSGLHGLNW